MSESTYCVIPLYAEIAKRLGISYRDLKEFLPDEIISYLKNGTEIDRAILARRVPISCYLTLEGNRSFFEGEDALVIKQTVQGQMASISENKTAFQGATGNKGKVQGKARVALSYQSVSETRKDEILVLASVSASFVPHLGKAAGIVAEQGGLTSHPVIVAREFNLPCVVGLKGITMAIKNGDLLEVDGDSGTVRKLS
jgi:phosphohistidine swiveling domain-containing protein